MMYLERLGLWPARLIWLVAPLTIGQGLAPVLEAAASTPGLVVEIALWLVWFGVLVATLTPSPRSLSICRVIAPATIGALVLAGLTEGWDRRVLLGLGIGALFTAVVFLPLFGDRMINGSAYGSERRMALRPPAFMLLGPAQFAWLLVFFGLVTAPLLILADRYVPAAVAAVVGAGAAWAGGRILHQLATRWVVFVPAGFVIRDPMTLADAVLLRRNQVMALGPAMVTDGQAARTGREYQVVDGRIDVSGGALGLALEVEIREATPISVRQRGGLRNEEVRNIVFSPTLPGAMLSEARIRGLKIGDASIGS